MKLKESIEYRVERLEEDRNITHVEAKLELRAVHQYKEDSLPEEMTRDKYNKISETELQGHIIKVLFGIVIERLYKIHGGVDLISNDPFKTREEIKTLIAQIETGEIEINK